MKKILLISLLCFGFNYEYNNEVVSVTTFRNNSNNDQYDWINEALSDMLTTDLSGLDLNIVNRNNLKEIIKEQKFITSSGLVDKQSIELGRILGASKIITGSYTIFNKKIRIDINFIDVESGLTDLSSSIDGKFDDFLLLEKKAVIDLASKLGIDIDDYAELKIMQLETEKIEAIEYNYKGVQAYDTEETDKAIEYFNEALTIDPFYESATKNLESSKVEVKGGLLFADFSSQKNKKEKQKEALKSIITYLNNNLWKGNILSYDIESDLENPYNAIISVDLQFNGDIKVVKTYFENLKKISDGDIDIYSGLDPFREESIIPRLFYTKHFKKKYYFRPPYIKAYKDVAYLVEDWMISEILKKDLRNIFDRHEEDGMNVSYFKIIASDSNSNIVGSTDIRILLQSYMIIDDVLDSNKKFSSPIILSSHTGKRPHYFAEDLYCEGTFKIEVPISDVSKIASIEIEPVKLNN